MEDHMSRPIYELHSALRNLLELSECLMDETGRNPAPNGAISNAKTVLQRYEEAATEQLRADFYGEQRPHYTITVSQKLSERLWAAWTFTVGFRRWSRGCHAIHKM
jgi:hypothetical protein